MMREEEVHGERTFLPPPLFFSPLWLQQRFWDRHGGEISFFADMAETFMPKCIALNRKLEKKKRNVAYARATDHFLWKMRLETRNDAKKTFSPVRRLP